MPTQGVLKNGHPCIGRIYRRARENARGGGVRLLTHTVGGHVCSRGRKWGQCVSSTKEDGVLYYNEGVIPIEAVGTTKRGKQM